MEAPKVPGPWSGGFHHGARETGQIFTQSYFQSYFSALADLEEQVLLPLV